MIDHVTIGVTDLERATAFYDAALGPLGIKRLFGEADIFAGYGADDIAFFWIGQRPTVASGAHIAFTARDRATVDRFHEAALAAGGQDNGKPGLRPHYHDAYYGAFVLDPDGHNIEAVCHDVPISSKQQIVNSLY
jgi:catechol 2,3-dioxygenase-like lactoylglutathione lyase family enzyme